jgi:hypothetical protein
MTDMYLRHTSGFANLVQDINPALAKIEVMHRSVLIGAMIEGLYLYIGHGKIRDPSLKGLEKSTFDFAVKIASAPPAPSSASGQLEAEP